jgi:hypothetical protein
MDASPCSAANASAAAAASTLLEEVPTRLRTLHRDVVAEEISSLEQINMGHIEGRIEEYSRLSERLGHHLGGHLMNNYEGFEGGMVHVQQVDLEFSLISVMIANSRKRLQNASTGIGQGGLYVARQRRRRERLERVQALASEFQVLLAERDIMEQFLLNEKYHDALRMNAKLLQQLRSERFDVSGSTNIFSRLREDLRSSLEDLKMRLREAKMRQAANAEVDAAELRNIAARYEEILDATVSAGFRSAPESSSAAISTCAATGLGAGSSRGYPVATQGVEGM